MRWKPYYWSSSETGDDMQFVWMAAALMFGVGAAVNLVWHYLDPLPVPVAGGAASFEGDSLVYAGGTTWQDGSKRWLKNVWIFDPRERQWQAGPQLPVAMAYGAFATVNGALQIFGGTDGTVLSRTSLRLRGGKWSEAGPAHPHPLLARADVVGDSVYVLGGCCDVVDLSTCSNAVLKRTGDGDWEGVSTIPHRAVALGATAAVGRRIFLFGGCSMPNGGTLANRAEAYVYDTAGNSWKKLQPLPRANRGLSAVKLSDAAIALFGGYTDSGFTAETLGYDIASDAYRPAAPLPLAAAGFEFLPRGDRILAMGGEDRMESRSARVPEGRIR
jgi:hypothetical protein